MEGLSPYYAYKETRLDLDPAIQGSNVSIRLPAHGTSTYNSRAGQKRPHVSEIPTAEDENTFRQRYLATSASIYHRKHHKSPRSFLWRILEDGKVLSIRVVDISRQRDVADSNLTLRLTFPHAIRSSCVAFSDSKEHDSLSAFILTDSKHLYTLTLRPDYFRKPSSTEDNANDWCKSYLPAATFKAPHRLVALGPDEVLISFIDGSLVRLDRNSGADGSVWKEQHYNEGGWGHHVRSIIPFQGNNTIRYGDNNLELSAVTSMSSPATVIDGSPYAFTISLDHRLRIWNLSSRKIAYMGDILDQEVEPHEQLKKVIDPSQSQLVRIIGENDEGALCVTYSPLGAGQFKFWKVDPRPDGSLDLIDQFPNNVLEPQTPSSEIWTLADFAVLRDSSDLNSYTLWALWKNNVTYRLHRLDFEAGMYDDVKAAWKDGWKAMATETLRETSLPTAFSGDSKDVTDKWLEFILSPGRFTESTIETGLAIYGRGLGSSKASSRKTGSIPDRMCSIVASTASLTTTSSGTMDYDQFRTATDAQWRRFYRLLQELDKQRGEALSLVIDPQGDMPWIILADGITAIRDCSALERIWHNNGMVPADTEIISRPLFAAAAFRDSLNEQFLCSCKAQLLEEIFQEPSQTDPARMRAFYEKCDFANQIGDEEYSQLVNGLGGGFKDLTPQVYDAMFALLDAPGDFDKKQKQPVRPVAEVGNKLLVKGIQETVELHKNVCLDQLVLLILIEGEINHGEEGIAFDAAMVFSQLMGILARLELVHWLASHQISLPLAVRERSNSISENTPSKKTVQMETITVLEGVLRHLFGLDLRTDESLSSMLTGIILEVCVPDSQYEAPPAVTQCFLLKSDRADLALEFARFTGYDSFSTYIQGRTCLAANDAQKAAMLFKKAAFGMANPKQRVKHHSVSYLDEVEKNLMNAGFPEYYSHVVALFDKEKIYSYVLDFARLSLQFIKHGDAKGNLIRTDMQSRLFNAALQTGRYEMAHSILVLFTDTALQQSSLRALITKMCEASSASQLVELPFIGLQQNVDDILAQKCQTIVDVNVGTPYHKILYSWRIKRNDYRGAAAICMERLQRLQQSGDGDRLLGGDNLETPVTIQYQILINTLGCVDPKQAWILFEDAPPKGSETAIGKTSQPKRRVITLEDLRRRYQAELDRLAAVQNDQFPFAGDDEMDVL